MEKLMLIIQLIRRDNHKFSQHELELICLEISYKNNIYKVIYDKNVAKQLNILMPPDQDLDDTLNELDIFS